MKKIFTTSTVGQDDSGFPDIGGLIDQGVSVAENTANAVNEYTQAVMGSESTGAGPSAHQDPSVCAAQGGTWKGSYCEFLPPTIAQGMQKCEKAGLVYDAAFDRCVTKNAANKTYTEADLKCAAEGKVFNYIVNSCVTLEESKLLETQNADLTCGKNSELQTTADGVKGCACKKGYTWVDSGATTDCKAVGGGSAAPATVKTAPKAAPKPAGPGYQPSSTSAKKDYTWYYVGGAVGVAAIIGAVVWNNKKKKKGSTVSG